MTIRLHFRFSAHIVTSIVGEGIHYSQAGLLLTQNPSIDTALHDVNREFIFVIILYLYTTTRYSVGSHWMLNKMWIPCENVCAVTINSYIYNLIFYLTFPSNHFMDLFIIVWNLCINRQRYSFLSIWKKCHAVYKRKAAWFCKETIATAIDV